LIAADKKVAAKEQEVKKHLSQIENTLDASDEYQDLIVQVQEAEINPLLVKAEGKGVVALDGLVRLG
jgi:succinyl-CoA synthetase beta subunit